MNFNQVETFLVLADCLSVTETAERLKRMNLQNAKETLRRFQKYVL